MKEIGKQALRLLALCAVAAAVGVAAGALAAVFGRGLLAIGAVRDAHPGRWLPFLPLAGAIIAWCYRRWGSRAGRGMGLVIDAAFDEEETIPRRLIPIIFLSTWATHLFGGSAGREGVAVQMGAALGRGAGRLLPMQNAKKLLLKAGMAAGFGGLFRTPFAAALFAVEVTAVGRLDLEALLPVLVASLTASWTSGALGLEKITVELTGLPVLDGPMALRLACLGLCFGLVGALFAIGLGRAKAFLGQRMHNPVARATLVGAVVAVASLACHWGRYSGLGTNLITAAFAGGTVYWYDWLAKLLFTVVTLAGGFQGGEVTPLFSIGASLGVWLAPLAGVPVPVAAAAPPSILPSARNKNCKTDPQRVYWKQNIARGLRALLKHGNEAFCYELYLWIHRRGQHGRRAGPGGLPLEPPSGGADQPQHGKGHLAGRGAGL